jgi:hypothetical protein
MIMININSNKEKNMIGKRYYMLIVMIALCSVAGGVRAEDGKKQLMEMATKMAETKQFSFSMRLGYDAVQKSGQKIEFSESRKILVSRPNHIRVDTQQSDGDTGGLLFDGKVITLFNTTENVYSQTKRPGDLDAAMRYAVGYMGVRVPLARMLVTTFPTELQKLINNADYVEQNMLGAIPTSHIAGRTESVDYQFWIAEDNLPRRIILTYKNEPGQPQFWAEFTDWNLSLKVSDRSFSFTPPKEAEKIPTVLPAAGTKSMSKMKGGSR